MVTPVGTRPPAAGDAASEPGHLVEIITAARPEGRARLAAARPTDHHPAKRAAMSKTLFTAAVLLIGLGHGALAAGPELLGCRGPFAKDANAATLVAAFGAANVAHEDLDVGEGFTEPGTVIFKSDGKRRIEVFWHDSETRSRPSRIIVHEPSAWRVALPGDSTASLGIGTELATVEAANRKPFTLNGFGWDGAGYVGEWSGGRLTKLDG